VPGQSNVVFGAEVASIGLVTLSVVLYNQMQPLPPVEGLTPLKRCLRALVSATAAVPLVIGGILLMFGFSGALYWAAAGVLISLAAGIWTAWILLIEIMRCANGLECGPEGFGPPSITANTKNASLDSLRVWRGIRLAMVAHEGGGVDITARLIGQLLSEVAPSRRLAISPWWKVRARIPR
jgi:hypothetical protein